MPLSPRLKSCSVLRPAFSYLSKDGVEDRKDIRRDKEGDSFAEHIGRQLFCVPVPVMVW
jgi:hypothetical protein